MNIHIFYSHYNITGTDNKNRPNWFDYEKCFLNLLNTIKDKNNVKLNIVMDGKIEDNWIKKYKELYNIYEFKGGNMEVITKAIYKIIKGYKKRRCMFVHGFLFFARKQKKFPKKNDEYLKMICNSMCGIDEEETEINMNKIISNVVKEVVINKDEI